MAVPQNFRSAFNGFNREDVVQYLEYINNKHQGQLNQLNEELAKLRERPEGVSEETLAAVKARCGELEQQLSELNEQFAQVQQRETDLNQQLEQAQQRETDLNQQLEQARQREAALIQQLTQEKAGHTVQTFTPDSSDDLEIFRLSARSERSAREQSELVYHQANGVLNEATARVTAASDDLTAAADRAMAQITQLQMAVSKSKQTLQDAASIMQAIKPNRI